MRSVGVRRGSMRRECGQRACRDCNSGARGGREMTRYQWLTVLTAGATLALIAVGAIVRTTGSGLGCPDWPLCQGGLIPPAERTAIIEYSHRTLAAVVGLLIVATAIVTLRLRREDAAARGLAVASLPLLGLQAWLGRETVLRELPGRTRGVPPRRCPAAALRHGAARRLRRARRAPRTRRDRGASRLHTRRARRRGGDRGGADSGRVRRRGGRDDGLHDVAGVPAGADPVR